MNEMNNHNPSASPFSSGDEANLNQCAKEMAHRAGSLWKNLAAVTLDIESVNERVREHVDQMTDLRASAETMGTSNQDITEASKVVYQVADEANQRAAEGQRTMEVAQAEISTLVEGTQRIESKLNALSNALEQVSSVSQEINAIAKQTNLLALNATIEAARAGEAGKGFAVVAGEVKNLSMQTSDATTHIEETVRELEGLLNELAGESASSLNTANSVNASTTSLVETFHDMTSQIGRIESHMGNITEKSDRNLAQCTQVVESVHHISAEMEREADALNAADTKAHELLATSEQMVAFAYEHGLETDDSPFIRIIQDGAAKIGAALEQALADGKTNEDDLFDQIYQPVSNTDPKQVTTRAVPIFDEIVRPIIDEIKVAQDGIVFCAPMDPNGLFTTHNTEYSKPQGDDPVWNAANSRNRRIFDDPVGLNAGRHTQPFSLKTYHRDMGGGQFVLMKDVSAPIHIHGRHWGGFRMGYLS